MLGKIFCLFHLGKCFSQEDSPQNWFFSNTFQKSNYVVLFINILFTWLLLCLRHFFFYMIVSISEFLPLNHADLDVMVSHLFRSWFCGCFSCWCLSAPSCTCGHLPLHVGPAGTSPGSYPAPGQPSLLTWQWVPGATEEGKPQRVFQAAVASRSIMSIGQSKSYGQPHQ